MDVSYVENCEGEIRQSADGCELTWDNWGCETEDGVGRMNGALRYVAADQLEGVISVDYVSLGCFSVYDVSADAL